jgi:hypothetical protein
MGVNLWGDGVLEYWSIGFGSGIPSLHRSITPSLHHSSTPVIFWEG